MVYFERDVKPALCHAAGRISDKKDQEKKQECTLGLFREECGVESVVVARGKMFKKPLFQVEQ